MGTRLDRAMAGAGVAVLVFLGATGLVSGPASAEAVSWSGLAAEGDLGAGAGAGAGLVSAARWADGAGSPVPESSAAPDGLVVPEPQAVMLLAGGLVLLAMRRREAR